MTEQSPARISDYISKLNAHTQAQMIYDNLDNREKRQDAQEQCADQIQTEIKEAKKHIQKQVRSTLRKVFSGKPVNSLIDPESQMSSEELVMMVSQAQFVMDVLEEKEEQVQIFKMCQAKKMVCQFCEHKGRSVVSEQQPWLTYVLLLALYLLIGLFFLIFVPFVVGLLRKQMHRCPKCMNEIREESVFESLNDNILEVSLGQFGILVKRRTLLKGLLLITACLACWYCWQQYGSNEIQRLQATLENQEPNLYLTWDKFQKDCSEGLSEGIRQHNFGTSFKGKVVSWEGVVVRVDSADSSNDLESFIDISLAQKHKLTAAEVLVSMGLNQQYDLVLTLDMGHLQKNKDVLEQLHHGTRIQFQGFVSSIGKRRTTALEAEENGVAHLVSFSVKIVSQPDQAQRGYRHADGRYS